MVEEQHLSKDELQLINEIMGNDKETKVSFLQILLETQRLVKEEDDGEIIDQCSIEFLQFINWVYEQGPDFVQTYCKELEIFEDILNDGLENYSTSNINQSIDVKSNIDYDPMSPWEIEVRDRIDAIMNSDKVLYVLFQEMQKIKGANWEWFKSNFL